MNGLHPNLDDWLADPELRRLWRDTWKAQHMQAGLQVLLQMGLPKPPRPLVDFMPGADVAQVFALRAARDGGYFDFARNIEELKNDPSVKPDTDPDSAGKFWGDADLNPPATPETQQQ